MKKPLMILHLLVAAEAEIQRDGDALKVTFFICGKAWGDGKGKARVFGS